jgi:uncharacterized membrane protein
LTRKRVEPVDVLRGIVMVLMALDHVRDYFGTADNPVNVARAGAALFFTRWVTHLCAPTFFLLTGVGASLARGRRSPADLSRLLVTRGLWLIVLELTVLRCFGYQFNVDYRVTMLVILWALGWAMIVLGLLVRLPAPAVTAFGVLVIATHNLFDSVRASSFGALAPLWTILHAQGFASANPSHVVFVAYPIVPWIGVTAAGYGLGAIYAWQPERRRAFLWRLGTALTLAFVVLRFADVYGDPSRWSARDTTIRTVMSFLNATKYPPSLLFLFMTLGPALLMLSALDVRTPRTLRPALTFGKVPFFYFMLHLPLIHLLAVVFCAIRYHEIRWMFESPTLDRYPFTRPPGWGYSLPVVYAIWIGLVLALYPACRWFADVRERRGDWWLGYL